MDADAAIVDLAPEQHGLVHARRRIARKWLIDRGDGLFQVGPILGSLAREMAALLRFGDRSVVSDGAAVTVWELRERRRGAPVDLTVATGAAGRRGVRLHRRRLAEHDQTEHRGLRITTPARTIADLSPSVPAVELQRLIEEVQLRNLATRTELAAYGRGRPALRAALSAHDEPRLTRSEAERRLLELIRAAGLPLPARTRGSRGWGSTCSGRPSGSSWRSTASSITGCGPPSGAGAGPRDPRGRARRLTPSTPRAPGAREMARIAQAAAGSVRSRAAWRLIGRLPQRAASA